MEELDKTILDKMIEEIIKLEWDFFDKVQNEGGRAFCQDDWETFSLMRRSQYSAWSRAMLESWRADLLRAAEEGRNPMTEKYGYMMAHSEPSQNAELLKRLPAVSEEKRKLCRSIVERLLAQNEGFRQKYPRLSGRGRPLRTEEEKAAGWTSVETYQSGELLTYSMKTLALLDEKITEFENEGKSYPETIIENSLKARGIKSAADAEARLAANDDKH